MISVLFEEPTVINIYDNLYLIRYNKSQMI